MGSCANYRPELQGPAEADVTLVGWGSTGPHSRGRRPLAEEGITANHLQIKYLVPFHAAEVEAILQRSKCKIAVEHNFTGQLPARHFVPRPASRWMRKFSNMTGNPLSPITSLSA